MCQYVARAVFYSVNLSTLLLEIIEVLADSSTESTSEPIVADAAFQLYLEKCGHYSVTMQTILFNLVTYSRLQMLVIC